MVNKLCRRILGHTVADAATVSKCGQHTTHTHMDSPHSHPTPSQYSQIMPVVQSR